MFALPELPFAKDSLAPIMSEQTVDVHYEKHHGGYVKKLNILLAELPGKTGSLEDIIRDAEGGTNQALFNNAAQCWNHSFFWVSMSALETPLNSPLTNAVNSAFGDLAGLKAALLERGVAHFGSGWLWLTADKDGKLTVSSSHDAHNLLAQAGVVPLLVCDLWEHAYYLDHKNDRAGFLGGWFDQLIDWTFVGKQYAAAIGGAGQWTHPLPTTLFPGAG